ncbi:MAG: CopD family protein [Pseudomonadota bacterium]
MRRQPRAHRILRGGDPGEMRDGRMSEFLLDAYDWIKALHIVSAMFWMAGLLYLPRLFVYQIEATTAHGGPGGALAEALKTYQRLLLKRIMNAAMLATWGFALLMIIANPGLFSNAWMIVKFLSVCALTATHMYYARARRMLESDGDIGPSRRWRLLNEIPAALAIIIVIMAVAEPF